jgi:YD repeat-containing protein
VTTTTRELDHRHNDGIDVTLLWDAESNRVSVFVRDGRAGEAFEVDVEPSRALDAFHHPYAYAAGSASPPPERVAT